MATAKTQTKRARRQVDAEGVAHIKATFNNTTVTITDMARQCRGRVGSAREGWLQGFEEVDAVRGDGGRGAVGREAVTLGVKRVHVRVQGPGSGRESAIQALGAAGLQVRSIQRRDADSA